MQAYKSPAHFMWATIGFTKKLSMHKLSPQRSHSKTPLQQQLDGGSCIGLTPQWTMELSNRHAASAAASYIVYKSLKETVHC